MRMLLAALVLLAASACATLPWQRSTLYEDLGGEPGLARIVDAFLDRLATDERIVHFFERTHVERFERMLTERLQNRLLARLAPLQAEIVEGDPCSAFAVGAAIRERCAALGGTRRGSASER